jgi:transcriptional regulator with XRE-family HTH domain
MNSGHPISFAALLRYHRVAAGLTQEDVAQRSGLSRRGISDIERGLKRRPYRNTVARLAKALSLADTERTAFEEAARASVIALRTVPTPPAPAEDEGSADGSERRGRGVARPVSRRGGRTSP